MEDRGWGWPASKVRQTRLIEWLAPRSSSVEYVSVKPFYDGQPDQAALTIQVVHDELSDLEQRSLIHLYAGIGGIESYDAVATAQGRRLAEEIQARRADRRLRKTACRDAMIDWLYARDATGPLMQPARDVMLVDPRWGTWLGELFSADDLDTAAAWLNRHSLVRGAMADQCEGPVRLYLTDDGIACAEEFGSDTARFLAAQRPNRTDTGINRSAGVQAGSSNLQVNHFYSNPIWAAGGRPLRESSSAATGPADPRSISITAQLTQRILPLSNGLHAGTMLAIEVQAHHELKQATVVMIGVEGPVGAATIPPPARLYWHPSREASATITQGASDFINVGRVGPYPPGAVMETPDQDLPWTLPNGQWQVELQLTARGYPALYLTALFDVSPANGFPAQHIEWRTLTARPDHS